MNVVNPDGDTGDNKKTAMDKKIIQWRRDIRMKLPSKRLVDLVGKHGSKM